MLRFISFLVFMMGVAAAIVGWAVLTDNVDKLKIGGDTTKVAKVEREVWSVEPASNSENEADAIIALEDNSAPGAVEDTPSVDYAEAAPPPTSAPMEMPAPAAAPPPVAKKSRSMGAEQPPAEEPVFSGAVSPEFSDSGSAPAFEEVLTESAIEEIMSIEPAAGSAEPQKSAEELFLESLRTVPIAHETPHSAGYKQPFDVVLAIDATGDDTAVDALPGRGGTVVEGTTQVSDQVEARLTGAAFAIEDNSPSVQKMSPVTENTWRWSVTPLKAGEHDLVFEIFAVDGEVSTPLRTYRDTVTVEVTGIGHAVAFADQTNPLFVLLGGLGSAIAGLFGVFSFFKKKRA